jgi:transposase
LGVERAEAEAIYDAGREVCVEFIVDLTTRYEKLEGRVARLEEQLRQSSRNSSAPPSSDPPTTRQQRRAEARQKATRSGLPRGAQPGHRGAGRTLASRDQLDETVDHYPTSCRGCGHELTDAERAPSRRPGRRQVAELPAITVLLTEHRAHRLRCPHCRARTSAQLPEEVRASAFGPRLQAAVVTLTARNRVSRRDMGELGGELFGTGLSVGAVDAICQRAASALEEPHERLVSSVLESAAVNIDETGWSRAGEGRTMWTAATPTAAIFRIATDRHRDRLEELIGESFAGNRLFGPLVGV